MGWPRLIVGGNRHDCLSAFTGVYARLWLICDVWPIGGESSRVAYGIIVTVECFGLVLMPFAFGLGLISTLLGSKRGKMVMMVASALFAILFWSMATMRG